MRAVPEPLTQRYRHAPASLWQWDCYKFSTCISLNSSSPPVGLHATTLPPIVALVQRKAHLAAARKSPPDQRNKEGLLPGCWLTCWRAADAVLLLLELPCVHIHPSSPAGCKLISWQPDENEVRGGEGNQDKHMVYLNALEHKWRNESFNVIAVCSLLKQF